MSPDPLDPSCKQMDVVTLQAFRENSLERFKVSILAKNIDARITSIQGMIQPACFVSSWWSRHLRSITAVEKLLNES